MKRTIRSLIPACVLLVLLLLMLLCGTARAAPEAPRGVVGYWTSSTTAILRWEQLSDADQVCVAKRAGQRWTLIDCLAGRPGWHALALPPGAPADYAYWPARDDLYWIYEYKQNSPLGPEYGPYGLWTYWLTLFSSAQLSEQGAVSSEEFIFYLGEHRENSKRKSMAARLQYTQQVIFRDLRDSEDVQYQALTISLCSNGIQTDQRGGCIRTSKEANQGIAMLHTQFSRANSFLVACCSGVSRGYSGCCNFSSSALRSARAF